MTTGIGTKWFAVTALAATLAVAGTADARQFSMSGVWHQQRGVAPIPVAPGGFIPGSGVVQAKLANPARFTVPPNVFGGTFSALFPLPQGSLIQLSTQFAPAGPQFPGVFQKNHWQGTRANASFAFCIGATANPNCTDHRSVAQGAAPGQGTKHGLVRYSNANPNRFGGTMQMVMGGGGVLSRVIGASPLLVLHLPFGGGGIGAAPTEAPGGVYNNTNLDYLNGGPISISPALSVGGLITAPGAPAGFGPPSSNLNHGFAWTTGVVYVKGTDPAPPPATTVTTVTLTGNDARTPMGAGTITLVAGGVTSRLTSGFTYMSSDTVTMTMSKATPSGSTTGYVVIVSLLVLTAGYFLRHRIVAS